MTNSRDAFGVSRGRQTWYHFGSIAAFRYTTTRDSVGLPVSYLYYAPPLIGGGIKRCFSLTSDICLSHVCLTSVCLSRTLGLTREQRGLGRLKLARFGWLYWQANMDIQ